MNTMMVSRTSRRYHQERPSPSTPAMTISSCRMLSLTRSMATLSTGGPASRRLPGGMPQSAATASTSSIISRKCSLPYSEAVSTREVWRPSGPMSEPVSRRRPVSSPNSWAGWSVVRPAFRR